MFDCRGKEIYLICGATDMRKGIDGLSSIINLRLVCDAFDSRSVRILQPKPQQSEDP